MFTDTEYINRTRELISRERKKIVQELSTMDSVKIYTPVANFVLVQILNDHVTSEDVFEHAIRQKMMIRDCSTFPFLDNKFIRFCFMDSENNQRLIRCLQEIL